MKKQKNSSFVRDFLRDESGATAIEYGLIASGLVMLIIGSISALSGNISGTFESVSTGLAENNNP